VIDIAGGNLKQDGETGEGYPCEDGKGAKAGEKGPV